MLGAVAGDIIGSIYEFDNVKTIDFPLFTRRSFFTDDSVHTIALADAYLHQVPYEKKLKEYYHLYPDAGYGGMFRHWAASEDEKPYNSYGNGAAMRVSPAGYIQTDLAGTLAAAEKSAAVTHNHPEGIKGAQAAAAAIFMARSGATREQIRTYTVETFGYNLERRLDDIRPVYKFNETCQETVPEAIIAFLESTSYENAVRLAVSLGGDSDTLACITGGIAEAFYGGIPAEIRVKVYEILDDRLALVAREFTDRYVRLQPSGSK